MSQALLLGRREYGPASCVFTVPSALPREMWEHVRELSALHVEPEHRGKGLATELMASACREADVCGLALMLVVEPNDDTITHAQLESFYSHHGFVVVQRAPAILMIRRPRIEVH